MNPSWHPSINWKDAEGVVPSNIPQFFVGYPPPKKEVWEVNLKIIPHDSILLDWCTVLSQTEVPVSYQIAIGISIIGCLLKRNIWVDQHSTPKWGWNVYPNQSVMLVGPSGVGKDTAINFGKKLIEKAGVIPVFGGTTIENIYHRMAHLTAPAACYLPAGELTSFIGSRDYQSGMVQGLTDLMSGNESLDVSTKTDLTSGNGPKIIQRPTLTLHCGSTEEWLHKAMPNGSLEGGFLGRFLIIVEEMGRKQVPLAKYEAIDWEERGRLREADERWNTGVTQILQRCKTLGEIVLLEEAKNSYTNWYYNRFNYFSKAVMPYANRSRDTVLRLAMIMAVTRGHFGWIEEEDIQFGAAILNEIGKRIDSVVLPPTLEAKCAREILLHLPLTDVQIVREFGRTYQVKVLEAAQQQLLKGGEIKRVEGKWVKV